VQVELRNLPSVDELARGIDDPLAVDAARAVLERARGEIRAGQEPGDLPARVRAELAEVRRPSLRRVVNATGVLVHTNLGRAPLPDAALARVAEASGYSNLELDLASGARGSRQDHVTALFRRLTGAEAALVVNNNAGALLLAAAALADGREVLASRGELIEIGDGFRIPEVLERSGARLVEVGTTNRTRARDYERALRPETALLLRVHQSNFRLVGFTERPTLAELADVARRHDVPLLDDLGSGALLEIGDEPTARAALEQGADLVCFSGDKLLGGPQAGIVLGRAELVDRLRRHPLHRALRIDKLSLAALEGTLLEYLEPARALRDVPVLRMLHEDVASVRGRAERLAAAVGGEVEETVARVGGGALPLAELPSYACAVEESLAQPLRLGEPAIVGIVRDGRLLLDCRTIRDDELDEIADAVRSRRA
jgi:L-seryl-tRNA(Ser) seleniumtransferase